MDTSRSAATSVVRAIVRAAACRGVASSELLAAVGLTAAALDADDGRVSSALEQAVWAEAVRRARDPALGLHAAETLEVGALGVVDYLACSSATLGDAVARIGRYHRLVHDAFKLDVETRRGVARIYQVLADPADCSPQCTEFALAALVVLGRRTTGVDLTPMEVSFQHGRPARVAEHHRFFRSRVRFNACRNELCLDPALLARPLVRSDPMLCAVLERYADELVARLPAGTSLRERVQLCLTEQMSGGNASAAGVAARLRMSTRQLQRRLATEGTTFRQMRQALRRSLAISYLGEQERSPAEVAFLLGFADPCSFHRAFKRWTGKTPAAYRRS